MMHQSTMMPSSMYPGFQPLPLNVPYIPTIPTDYSVPSTTPVVLYPVPALGNHGPSPPPPPPPITGKPFYPDFDSGDNDFTLEPKQIPSVTHAGKIESTSDDDNRTQREQSEQPTVDEKSPAKVRSRRQRAKHLIVPMDLLVTKTKVPGLFIDITEDEFDEMVYDNETALAFAARVGLIQNMRRCPKCEREMALCKFNNSCGYRWVCRRTEQGRRFTCSVRGMRKDTVLDDRLVGILTMLRIMFHFSNSIADSEIITKLDIGHVRSARTILSRLRDMVDAEITKFDGSVDFTTEQLRRHFFSSDEVDHFGFLLFWGTRYKPPEKNHDGDDSEDGNEDNGD